MDLLEIADTLARFGAACMLPVVCVLLVRVERRVASLDKSVSKLELDIALMQQREALVREWHPPQTG